MILDATYARLINEKLLKIHCFMSNFSQRGAWPQRSKYAKSLLQKGIIKTPVKQCNSSDLNQVRNYEE